MITTRPRNARYQEFRTQMREAARVQAIRERSPDLPSISSLESSLSHSIQFVPSKTLNNTRGRPHSERVHTMGARLCRLSRSARYASITFGVFDSSSRMIAQGFSARDNLSDEQAESIASSAQSPQANTGTRLFPCSFHATTSVFKPNASYQIGVPLPRAQRDDESARSRYNDNICRHFTTLDP
jgi:hypothetical protein